MGAVGPQRVDFPADGTLPELPPKLVQNESSWLAFADLVFVDPVGTGFSRIIEPDKQGETGSKKPEQQGDGEKPDPNEYFGQKRDLESMCEFMASLAVRERPLGLTRLHRRRELRRLPRRPARADAAGGDRHRPQRRDPDLAGARADCARLRATTSRDDVGRLAADDGGRRRIPWSLARVPGRGRSLDEVRAGAEEFASGDYATFLIRGALLGVPERERTLERLADFLGLPLELVTRAEGRINPVVFARELLRDERKVVGFYDVTITGTDPFPDRPEHGAPDPTLAGIGPAYTAAINRQLRSEIGVETDREYRLLSLEVNQAWKEDTKRHFFAPPEGATDSFRYGMALNPHMRAFLTHGRYDMATPYYASDRLRNLMRLDPDTTGRLTVRHFEGGHMFYAWEESRHAFTAAIEEFVGGALAGRADRLQPAPAREAAV